MELPRCKNPSCPKPQTKLLLETDSNYQMACLTCNSMWVVSKPAALAQGRYDAQRVRVAEATKQEKEKFIRKKFGPPKSGWLEING